MARTHTIKSILEWAINAFENADIESPKLDAEILLAQIVNLERLDLYFNRDRILTHNEEAQFKSLVKRRAQREPVAYILGYKEFWSLKIATTPDVLIPRPETEGVVELSLKHFKDSRHEEIDILDLCTGSGCIAAALATELPRAKIVATDISPEALNVAKQNLVFAGNRINFFIGDLFSALHESRVTNHESRKFDLITANPPYIAPKDLETLPPEIRRYEPLMALNGGLEGLAISKRILNDAWQYLKDSGLLIMEMGINQSKLLENYARQIKKYNVVKTIKDYSGIERYLILQKWKHS